MLSQCTRISTKCILRCFADIFCIIMLQFVKGQLIMLEKCRGTYMVNCQALEEITYPSGNSGSCQPAWHSSFRPSKSSPFLRASRSSSGSNSTESSSSSSNTSSLSSSAVKNRQPAKNHSHLSRKHHYDYYSRQCNRAEPTSKQRPVPLIAYEAARVPSGHRNMKPSSPNISQFIGQHRTHEASSRDDHKFRNRSSGIGRTCGTSQSRESSGHTRNAWQPISAAATSVTHTVAVVPTTAATLTSTSNTGNYFEAPPALPIDHDYLLGPATTAPANTGFSAWSGKWQAVSPSNPDDDAVRPPGTHTSSKAAHTQAKGYEKSVRNMKKN
ncbi:unnamed protein product [Protopolystoma xenopodis]|uniref:Uncharacterized protein n=1 Tax=Protopolystoma xenopodis TaxID=117903 RepID=A0A448WBM8_9PLAT|nr:unnamed protein product [Protopolystoma xenopodis]